MKALDLAQAGISSIVWATGFSRHFDWIESPSIAAGCDPVHVRGVRYPARSIFPGPPVAPHASFEFHRWCWRRRSVCEGPDPSPGRSELAPKFGVSPDASILSRGSQVRALPGAPAFARAKTTQKRSSSFDRC